jgi:hypothetical protein
LIYKNKITEGIKGLKARIIELPPDGEMPTGEMLS